MTSNRSSRWLFGPVSDLMFGCGAAYMVVFLVLALVGPGIQLWLPATLLPLLAVVAGGPHYGATLLRAYERKEDQIRYRRVTLVATLALALVFLISLRFYLLGTLIVTIYLLWSPWHYSGQNYGLMLMFLGRRGISIPPTLKRWIRVSFVLSFLLLIVQLNGESPAANYAPGVQARSSDPTEPVYTQMSLGIPAPIQAALFWGLVVAYLGALGVAGAGLFRRGSPRDLLPALAILVSQALWFSLPAIARNTGLSFGLVPLDADFAIYTFHYIAAAHAIQYIWVTLYFNRKTHAGSRMSLFYGKSMLAGQLIWGLPALVFAPLMIGSFSYSSDLALLVASIVNLHHFVLDGAIWKLRDRRVGRVLIEEASDEAAPPTRGRSSWILPLVCVTGAIFVVMQVCNVFGLRAFAQSSEQRDVLGAEQVLDRLDLVTRDDYELRIELGFLAKENGDLDAAIRAFGRSVELRSNPRAWYERALLLAVRRQWELAADSFEGAYALADFPVAYTAEFVQSLIQAGRRERAIQVLSDELRRFPRDPTLLSMREGLASGA
jgi:hypothetical protein